MRGGAPRVWGVSVGTVLLAGLVAAAFIGVFFRWIWRQHRFSAENPADWGHAWVIPLVCVYLLWQRRDDLARMSFRPFWPGLVPLVLGLYGYFFFIVGVPNHMLQGFSMVLALFGLVLWLAGPTAMTVLILPIAYLVFAVRISQGVMTELTFKLQMVAAEGAYVLLKIIGTVAGFDAMLEGQAISMIDSHGNVLAPMSVGAACAGMRTVIAFVALGAAVAILGCRRWWQRVALVLLAVPVAVFLNIVRVAVLGLLALANPNFASGEAHTLIGTLLLIPGLGLFVLVMWALNRAVNDGGSHAPRAPPSPAPPRAPLFQSPGLSTALAAAAAILLVTATGLSAAIKGYKLFLDKQEVRPRSGKTLQGLPLETENWKRVGSDGILSAEELEELGTENYISRVYEEKNPAPGEPPRRIDFHAAYYTGMIDTVPHIPDRCYLGGGMQKGQISVNLPLHLDPGLFLPLDRSLPPSLAARLERDHVEYREARLSAAVEPGRPRRVLMPRNPERMKIRVSEFLTPDGGRFYAGYFFIANGGTVERAEQVRLLAFNLTDYYAYYAKIQFRSFDAQSAEELAEDAASLLNDLFPEIMYCIPDWLEVEAGTWPPGNPNAAPAATEAAPTDRR